MNSFFIGLFGLLSVGAAYMTYNDIGVIDNSVQKHNIRNGSVHHRSHSRGSYRGGK